MATKKAVKPATRTAKQTPAKRKVVLSVDDLKAITEALTPVLGTRKAGQVAWLLEAVGGTPPPPKPKKVG